MPTLIVFSGLPASGKTTLAARVAQALQFEHIDKDTILETLFDAENCRTPDVRSALSRKADGILVSTTAAKPDAVVSSWWRHPLSDQPSGTPIEWLSQLRRTIIEVHCQCPASMALQRFLARHRHPGHLDVLRKPDQLLAQFRNAAAHGPLFPERALLCNTDRQHDALAIDELADRIRQRVIAEGVP